MTDAPLTMTQYTDPLCAWSWNAEPVLQRLRERYREQLAVDFVMGGLTESGDEAARSVDVASHWQAAAERDGMPIDIEKWQEAPHHSSHRASVAYKAAELQEESLSDSYLRRLREAVATEHRDIEQQSVLVELATEVGYDGDRFRARLTGDAARERLQQDRDRTREDGVTGFPTYQLVGPAGSTRVVGDQPVEEFTRAVDAVAPDLEPAVPRPLGEFLTQYSPVSTREVAAVYGICRPKAEQALESLRDDGRARRAEQESGTFWQPRTTRSPSRTIDDAPQTQL